MTRTGFPWADVASDGSSIIGKHDNTGGEVSVGTVTSQLLYEIGSPAYLGPDVTTRFDTIKLEQVEPDRVQISNTCGEPPPETLKVAMNELGGYRSDLSVALTGLDIKEKAELVDAAFWEACPYQPSDFSEVTTRIIRTDKPDPKSNEEAVAFWRLSVKDADERKVGRALSNAVNELALATIPGMFGVGGRGAHVYGVYRPAVVPSDLVPQYVSVLGGKQTIVESTVPDGLVSIEPLDAPPAEPPSEETVTSPIGRIVGTRSGDKGGNANLGVFARDPQAWIWLNDFLTTEKLRSLLPETSELKIDRYCLPNILSLNFVIHGILEEGVAASTRQDGQAKSLGEWLRARVVEIPKDLLE
jgi:hypothetical protein